MRDDLQPHHVGSFLSKLEQCLDAPQLSLRLNVCVTPDRDRAVTRAKLDGAFRPFEDGLFGRMLRKLSIGCRRAG
jgi:hypothetical protein